MSEGSVKPIAEVADPWHDVFSRIKPPVHDRSVDADTRIISLNRGDAFRRRDDARDPDLAGTGLLEQTERDDCAPACCEHRIDDEDEGRGQNDRQPGVVLKRDSGVFIPLKPDVTHARLRHQCQNRVEHAKTGPKDRYDNDVERETTPVGRAERRANRHFTGGHLSQGFGRQEDADPPRRAAEMFGRRLRVAEVDERVVDQRMIDKMKGHVRTLYNFRAEARTLADCGGRGVGLLIRQELRCRAGAGTVRRSRGRTRPRTGRRW